MFHVSYTKKHGFVNSDRIENRSPAPVVVFVLILTCSISSVLCQMPELPRPKNGIYVVAHRGVHNGIPENSLPAYQKAIETECDFVEIDVRTSKDGHLVSIHNSEIDEYVNGSEGKVSDLTLSELKSLDIGKKAGKEWVNTRIPTLEEILDLCKGKIGIYLDLKKASVSEIVRIIALYGMESNIIWYIPASDTSTVNELKEVCPSCILMADPGNGSNIKSVTEKFKPPILATDMNELDEKFVIEAHRSGSLVIVDEKEGSTHEWKRIIGWDTDGIQTDNPVELITFLRSEKHR